MTNTFIKRENIQQKSKVELSGSEFLKKLEKKKAASKKDWNRNVFTVRTNDDISFLIREYCKENNISKNHFLMNLLKDFFKYGSI
tara:strand:- start:25 stop:279 length:255 start_codon:yes stop_codon:yes gene_type:complete